MKAPRSLKARALQWLAQREQSRVELRRKLLPHALAEDAVIDEQVRAVEARMSLIEAAESVLLSSTVAAELAELSLTEPTVQRVAGSVFLAAKSAPASAFASASASAPAVRPDAAARVEAVLDWLEAHQYLSADRFVESRVHARSSRFGNLRIRHELQQHGMGLAPELAQTLKDNELERARAVCARKFPEPPVDLADRARQARFLSARGFSPEVVRQAIQPVCGGLRRSRSPHDEE